MVSNELIILTQSMFGQNSDLILVKFDEYCQLEEWISHDIVLKAILKLSNGDDSKVDKYLKMAKIDPRDVVMLAEDQ